MKISFENGSKIQSIDSKESKRSIRGIEQLKKMGEWDTTYDELYFKVHCLYDAKTELYNRTLTDIRNPYNITEAFILDKPAKTLSDLYAKRLYEKCYKYLLTVTREPFNVKRWYKYHTCCFAQEQIDLFNQLVKDGEINSQMLGFFDDEVKISYEQTND